MILCLVLHKTNPLFSPMRNLQNIDLNLFKALVVLMEERSVSKAAKRLHITQPAMSGILLRLRESFDDPLFVRVARGIEPTNKAIQLAQSITPILQNIEQLLQVEQFMPEASEIVVKIACTDYALATVITPFIQQLRQQAPLIKLATTHLNEPLLQQQLEKRQIDFALVTPEYQAPDIHYSHLYQEEYVCVIGKQHPLAQKTSLTLDDFCQCEQALVSYSGNSFSGIVDEVLKKLGRSRNVVLSIQNFLILPDILQQQPLLAVLPKRLVRSLNHIHYFTPPFAIPGFSKTLIWHERIHLDPAYIWLRKLLAASCR